MMGWTLLTGLSLQLIMVNCIIHYTKYSKPRHIRQYKQHEEGFSRQEENEHLQQRTTIRGLLSQTKVIISFRTIPTTDEIQMPTI